MAAEGWFKDPFAIHEARWFSAGTPTDLVRDGGSETSDPPPDTSISGDLEQVAADPMPTDAVPTFLSASPYPETTDPAVIFQASNARGCFSILGLWVLGVAAAFLPLLYFGGRGWSAVAIVIEAALVAVLSLLLLRRRGVRRSSGAELGADT